MSHFTKVETKIKDLVILKEVLEELGFSYTEGEARVRGYRGQNTTADMVIHTNSKYDIGVQATEEGYQFISDWWGVQVHAGIEQDEFLQQVNQKYSYKKVMKEIRNKGYQVAEEEVDEHQTIKLVVRKWSD